VKRIGFLSFGHWRDVPGSQTRSAADSLLQTVELAQAAEDIGVDGAFVRVHHFERRTLSAAGGSSSVSAGAHRR
jgi:alkanesulfonate monooxygenase SsuD/methylene tetrahydromethanopterin reductase-like flavin-dependent oxidoreductase (luciferase family)